MSSNRSAIHNYAGRKRCGLCISFLPVLRGSCGSRFLVVLLFAGLSLSGSAMSLSDTITVDGVPLQLELNIMEVTPPRPPAKEGKGKKLRGRAMPDVLVGFGGGVLMRPTSAQGETLDAFLQQGLRSSAGGNMAFEWRQQDVFLRLNLSADVMNEVAFDARFLDDSLLAVEPDGNGGLEQHIFRTYELGIEVDTLSLPTSNHTVTSGVLSVSLGGVQSSPRGRGERFRWWAGFHWRAAKGTRGPSQINRMISGRLPSPAAAEAEERNDWESNRATGWGVQAGLSRNLNQGPLYLSLMGQWSAGDQGRWSCLAGLGYRLRSRS